ncbi:cold-shock protein [Chloroflexota bacterium]
MPKGTIKRLMDRGFGFIKGEGEGDLFFHRNDLEGVEFNSLSEGQEVEFEKGQGSDGRPQANKVRLTETQASDDDGGDQGGDDQGEGEGEA